MEWYQDARSPLADVDFDPHAIYARIMEIGTAWAEAQAAYDLLYETKKILVAKLKQASGAKSDAAAETAALSDPAYEEHIQKLCKASEEANRLRVQYESLKVLVDLIRSKAALKRTEAQIL
ncbi:MAG: hypothetical protein KatS3mg054_0137 [Chloroflexus sp.]|nr:MAG: hypothetical protein KatS3mg054_0137 [Chloroflexus sp.]